MISELFAFAIWWNTIQNYPGFVDAFGYLYGLAAASFAVEAFKKLN
jgi:hypothetical protein